ncbi:hypothetical protein FNV43_RR21718 [Rhamnella rubrinervis]|uniref:Uncharacterized protein n=1 Tax=Rhamnella rubrinervis TaxID=2594499 RepID=A0A8K0DSZ1_9ROSA|nr:hypothetical protein FNV43_RR21718 [Rhamnella rubrinervis]
MNKKKVKELEDTVAQLEEKSDKATQELERVKSSTDKTVETKVAHQLNACLSQIEQNYYDLDLSWVYEDDVGDIFAEGPGAKDTIIE